MRAWILYSLVRLGLFAAVFVIVLLAAGADFWWVALIAAAVASLTLSYIFFGSLRAAVAADLQARAERRAAARQPVAGSDEAVEDALGE